MSNVNSTPETTESVRVAIYATFSKLGRAPTVPELSATLSLPLPTIRSALVALHASHDIVLSSAAIGDLSSNKDESDTDPRAIVMAHPFSTVPLGFSVMGNDVLWWGGCVWDSFALPHLLPAESPVLVSTRCRGCEIPMALDVGTDAPPKETGAVAHFLVPTSNMWDDVVHTCGNQRMFCSEACVDKWCSDTGNKKGYTMDMATLWNFAKGWYQGRLDHGYKRREPAQAKGYFRSVGLEGSFWGL